MGGAIRYQFLLQMALSSADLPSALAAGFAPRLKRSETRPTLPCAAADDNAVAPARSVGSSTRAPASSNAAATSGARYVDQPSGVPPLSFLAFGFAPASSRIRAAAADCTRISRGVCDPQ